MKGKILDYSVQNNSGVISGVDGERYTFVGSEWKSNNPPLLGMSVDFDAQGKNAVGVYKDLVSSSGSTTGDKNKITAGLLAIFLGGFGVHKFYLGYNNSGLVYLLTNTIGWIVTAFLLGLPNIALAIIALIEGITYLQKSDEEFNRIYVQGKKEWF